MTHEPACFVCTSPLDLYLSRGMQRGTHDEQPQVSPDYMVRQAKCLLFFLTYPFLHHRRPADTIDKRIQCSFFKPAAGHMHRLCLPRGCSEGVRTWRIRSIAGARGDPAVPRCRFLRCLLFPRREATGDVRRHAKGN